MRNVVIGVLVVVIGVLCQIIHVDHAENAVLKAEVDAYRQIDEKQSNSLLLINRQRWQT
jgi:hypothetical protein